MQSAFLSAALLAACSRGGIVREGPDSLQWRVCATEDIHEVVLLPKNYFQKLAIQSIILLDVLCSGFILCK